MEAYAIEKYMEAGSIAGEARDYGMSLVKEGVSILEVAEETERFIRKKGGKPAFPTNIAIDSVAAHFTPTHSEKRTFERGNLVKVDVGAQVDGYIGDTAGTVEVGTKNWTTLIKASKLALETAIELIRPKAQIRMIGGAIERAIESQGYKPVSNLTGHSMERYSLHAGKSIPNILDDTKTVVELGDVLAIEPFATNGAGKVSGKKCGNIYRLIRSREMKSKGVNDMLRFINDNFDGLPFSERWCYRYDHRASSKIRKLVRFGILFSYPILSDAAGGMVAQAEHTVVVTENGCKVTTHPSR